MLNCIAFLTNRHSMIPVCLFNGPWSMLTSSSPPLASLPESTTLITKGPTVSCLKLTVHESIADNTRLSTRHCYYIVLEKWKLVKKKIRGIVFQEQSQKKPLKLSIDFSVRRISPIPFIHWITSTEWRKRRLILEADWKSITEMISNHLTIK